MKKGFDKIWIVLAVFVLGIFLSGCEGGNKVSGTAFIGGTEGLKTEFLAGNPPDKTTDGGTSGFSIVVKASNIGENSVDANDGYVQIWGMDTGIYGASETDFKKYFNDQSGFGEELLGARRGTDGSVLNGGVATIEFGDLSYNPTIQGDMQQTIWANICYKYKTKVATQICVKNNVEQALSNNDICSVEEEKSPQNSGSPIHVTSLKEAYAGNGKISVTLTIRHVGSGDNFFKDDQLNCNDVESNNDRGKVHIEFKDVQIGGRNVPVVCQGLSNDGYVRLYSDNSGAETTTVYCTVDVSGSNNVVEVPLELELSYVYLQHITKEMTIRHISS